MGIPVWGPKRKTLSRRSSQVLKRLSKDWSRSMRGIEEAVAEKEQGRDRRHEVKVGIVGYGTVGRATAKILTSHAEEIRQRTGGVAVTVTRICRKTPRDPETAVNGI